MVSTDRKAGSKQRRRSNRAQAKHKPDSRTPSAATARSIAQWEDNEWKLFVSTASKVSVWDGYTCTRIFSSASEGIVIAKRAKDGSALAIADSQVVVLHKVEEGQPMSYRLKGSEGPCRLLQYSHDSKVLFFTDSIHNTVQSYNIPEGRVSDAGLPHPSPISAFAVSADSNLILSCSETPPVVQLHNRLLGTTSTIVPQASIKPVTTCTFHPTRKHTFILAFKDGIVAAYDSTKLVRAREDNSKKPTKVADHIHKFEHLHDPSVSGNPGVTAIQFIPGYKAKAVSVGEDGRAFVLDFEQKDVQASWHVGAPITSLSIRSSEDHGWLAAVGTVHGMCLVYDSEGKKLCDRAVDSEGAKILGVEWISGEVRMPQLLENDKQVGKVSPLSAPEFKVGNVLARAREQERERQSNSLERIEKPRERQSNSLERTEKLKDYFDTEITRDRALKEQTNSRQPSEKASTSSSLQQEESLKERRSKLRQEQSLTKEESSSRPRQEVPSVKSETSSKHRQESPPAKAESSSKLRQDSTSAKAETSSRHRRELSSVKADASSKHRQDLPLSKADTALKRVDSGPPKLPEFHADGAALMDGVDPHTSDFMSMFSPVKKPSALTLSSSLPDRKPKKARDASDAKESDGDRFDQRSALSAPQLWDEKIEALLRPPTKGSPGSPTRSLPSTKDSPPSSPSPGTPPSPTIRSILDAKKQEKNSSFRPKSSPISEKRELGYKPIPASDISILSEIRNIRSGNIPKRDGPGMSVFAPYMPSRPGFGKKAGNDSILRPELASAAKKAIAENSQLLEKSLIQSSPSRPIDGATGMFTSPPHQEDSYIEDLSDDGDIWLAAERAASSSSSRKRKGSDSGGTRPGGLARNWAKKNKTSTHLHWDASVIDHPQERTSPSRPTDRGDFLDMDYLKAPRHDSAAASSPGSLTHSDGKYQLAKLPFENDIVHQNMALSTEIDTMRRLFQEQFTTLQQEMAKEFRAQRKLLESMKRDMASLRNDNDQVWRENERLKMELKKARSE